MSAVRIQTKLPCPAKTLLDIMREDVRYGAPGAHLEAAEIPRWVKELDAVTGQDDMTSTLCQAMSDLEGSQLEHMNKLLAELCGDMSADRLVELRDSLRGILTDYCIEYAERMIEREEGYDYE